MSGAHLDVDTVQNDESVYPDGKATWAFYSLTNSSGVLTDTLIQE